ncbi:MAG TPA: ABC transporter permease [Pontiellaceae bacterium]|nr:ABC transporter permease [Pontiellaceae bacterium]
MFRYIAKRILQMISTVFGVILITFILFNAVGGSPALQVLGRHVSPQALEEFDEQRGFNKPLFIGTLTTTRAYADSDFERTAGDWQGISGVTFTNGTITLAAGGEYALPLKFALRTDCKYELELEARSAGFPMFGEQQLKLSKEWKTIRLRFETPGKILPGTAEVEIRSIKLRRVMNSPFDSQFIFYLKQLAHLDFGVSSSTNQRVSKLLLDGIGPSLMLTVPIFFAGLVAAVMLSLFCAFWRDTWIDRFFVVFSVALMSVNYLVWIVGGQYLLGFKLGWFPVWGFEDPRYLILPVLIGVFSGLGAELRFYRTIMLDEMHRDYVRTARAKGVSRGGVLFKHVLKNALIPIITNTVIAIPFLYTGSLLLESFFGIPGLGYLSVNAINSSDVDVVRAVVLVGSILFVVANLLTDLCYALVDPRVKLK